MNSMKIGTYQMDTTFGLYLPEYTIPAPAVQTNFVKIIGRDGSVDLSNALGLHYDSRTWSLDFKCFDPTVNWHTLSSQVMNAIHGKRLNFEFDDDPNYFWTGRVSVQNYVSNHGTGTLKVTIVSDPFKYAKLSTIVTKTASTGTEYTGALVTFNTANAKINDLSVTMQPLQDLHGYDHPWPAGGGVNKLDPIAVFGGDSSIYDVNADGTVTVKSGDGRSWVNVPEFQLPAGTYNLSKENATGLSAVRLSTEGYSTDHYFNPVGGYTFTFSEPASIKVKMSYASATYPKTEKPQIVIGQTAPTAWTPYSNICPISGRTGLSVYRTGKNLFDQSDTTYLAQDARAYGSSDNRALAQINTLPAGTYTLSFSEKIVSLNGIEAFPTRFGLYLRATNDGQTFNVNAQSALIAPTVGQIITITVTFTLTDEYVGKFKYFYVYTGKNDSHGAPNEYTANIYDVQIELGSTATTYEPFNGNTYAVDWTSEAGTVYGGTDEVVGGVLTDEWAEIPSYNGETITEPWLSSMDEYAPGATPTTGAQVVYKLATPITYQLTAQEVEALVGTNNVWSDGGNVTVAVVTPETLTNNGRAVVPTLTASADMVLKWGNYSASVQQGTSTIPQLILENGANLIYIIGTGSISFTWQEASL